MLDKIKEIIAEQLGTSADKLTDDNRPIGDYGADSLDAVELSIRLEDEFNIEFSNEFLHSLQWRTTIADLAAAVEKK